MVNTPNRMSDIRPPPCLEAMIKNGILHDVYYLHTPEVLLERTSDNTQIVKAMSAADFKVPVYVWQCPECLEYHWHPRSDGPWPPELQCPHCHTLYERLTEPDIHPEDYTHAYKPHPYRTWKRLTEPPPTRISLLMEP